MNRFKFSRKYVLVAIGLVFIATVSGCIYFFNNFKGGALSAEQLDEKFSCGRITADFRYTDVFCGNPKFYNNPEGINYDEYYAYQGCKERLENQPPAESLKETDPGFYNAYYDCKDPTKLDQLRQDFIQSLKELIVNNN